MPNGGPEQTSSAILDIDHDGLNDFVISERRSKPSLVWYRRGAESWTKYVVDSGELPVEAGTTFADVDGDGNLDIIAGADYRGNEVWWWENPFPNYQTATPWKRHAIKHSGGTQHHDLAVADLYGDGKQELIFWNQGSHALYLAHIPGSANALEDSGSSGNEWPLETLYTYSETSEPEQRGSAASFKPANAHEGLAVFDIDGDGKLDIAAGGHWFRNRGDKTFEDNIVDAGNAFARVAAGHLLSGSKTAQIVMVIGDGQGPLIWYGLQGKTWISHLIAQRKYAHNIQLIDINGDGNLDIFNAEQRLNGDNPEARVSFFLGDGKGNFKEDVVAVGLDAHESKVADLNGDGKPDILVKPYNYKTPGLDVFLQK